MEKQQEVKKEEKQIKQQENSKERVYGVPFVKDDPRINKEGRPLGSKDFTTIFNEALKKIAKEKDIDPDSVEVNLVLRAISEARKGNFKFYKDIFDRKYGKAQGYLDVTSKGQEITGIKIEIVKGLVKKPDDTTKNNKNEGNNTVREEP